MRKLLTILLTTTIVANASAQDTYTIYPVPHTQKAIECTANFTATVNIIAEKDIDDVTVNRAKEIIEARSLAAVVTDKPVSGQTNLLLGVNGSKGLADNQIKKQKLDREVFSLAKFDRHILSLNADKNGIAQVTILGENTDATFCGLASLEQILDNGVNDLQGVVIYDYADIKDRGIIEGYYGVPYSAAATKDIFRFMARYKMNTYMYGAKSDPYHSQYWSDPYPTNVTEEQVRIGYLSQDMLKDITDVAHATKVNFIWAIHPGTAFMNPDEKDVIDRIMAKFEDMYKLGVRQFGVFVDDVGVPYDAPSQNLCADRITELQNKIDQRWNVMGASPADTVKPIHYVPQLYAYGWTTMDKARSFFSSLKRTPEKINIYITGEAVWSVPSNKDIEVVTNFLGRNVSWWWNYPCNDNAMSRLFTLDTYTNFRDEKAIDNLARLETSLNGLNTLILNPMQQGEVAKTSFFCIADYSWNTAAFNNDLSWQASLPAIMGKERAADFRIIAPYLRYFDNDAFGLNVTRYKESVEKGKPAPQALIKQIKEASEALKMMKALKDTGDESDALYYEDARPWILKLDAMFNETLALLEGKDAEPVDYENCDDFKLMVLDGMGTDIKPHIITAEPCGEVLRPFIDWLRQQKAE